MYRGVQNVLIGDFIVLAMQRNSHKAIFLMSGDSGISGSELSAESLPTELPKHTREFGEKQLQVGTRSIVYLHNKIVLLTKVGL